MFFVYFPLGQDLNCESPPMIYLTIEAFGQDERSSKAKTAS